MKSYPSNMALCNRMFRRRKFVFILLCGTTFWIVYLFLSLPSANKTDRITDDYNNIPVIRDTVSRKYFATVQPLNPPVNNPEEQPADAVNNNIGVDMGKLVLDPPHQVELVDKVADNQDSEKIADADALLKEKRHRNESQSHLVPMDQPPIFNKTKDDMTRINATAVKLRDSGGFDKLVALGEKLRNKTREVGEHVKNKTLAVLGIHDTQLEKPVSVIFHSHRWNLTVSFEDIGEIMKETEFLNRRSPLDLHAPVLLSRQNRTSNYTLQLKSRRGFCDCWDRHCMCCARLIHKRLHLNNTVCSNFTYLSKSQEFDLVVSVDSKPIDKSIIQAHTPPVVCVGSSPKVADVCVRFFNTTFKVNVLSEHRTQILGCTDFSLNLYNKTLALVPVDCFQIPGDANHRHADRPQFPDFGNWMP